MTFLEITLLLLLILSFALIIIVLVYYKFFRRFTRERFAFLVFLLVASLSTSLIFILLGGKSPFVILVNALAKLTGLGDLDLEPSWSDKVLAVFVIIALIHLAIRLHKDWPGETSVREHEASLLGIKPGLIRGALAAAYELSGKATIEPYNAERHRKAESEVIPSPGETKAWHHWVARILQLSSSHLRIDELKEWFPEQQLFISQYGPKRAIVGVWCCESRPSADLLDKKIEFITQQESAPSRLIIAIESERGENSSTNVSGVSVEYCYRDELLAGLVDFSTYVTDIKYRYEIREIAEGYSLKIPDVYVPNAGFALQKNQQPLPLDDVEEFIVSWASEKSLRHLAVLGEYGQGKSVLALRLTYRLLHSKETARTPLLITLGGRSPRTQSKLGILAEWAAAYDINPRALLALHEAGRLILIFDGFDEMDLVGDASLRVDHFRTLWEYSRDPLAKMLLTGRPNFFLDELERERSLNLRQQSSEVPYTVPIYLSVFSAPQIESALRSFDPNVRSHILGAVQSKGAPETFRDLISRPSTLFLAANIWGELGSVEEIRSAKVIDLFINHNYERQQRKGLKSFLTPFEREYFTVGIALAMYEETGFSNHVSKVSFQRAIARLIDSFPQELSKYEFLTVDAKEPLRDRLHDREMLIETVSTDVRSCGILVTDLSQVDAFKFAHKSFFELLVAKNVIYTSLPMQIGKDAILHHAARSSVAGDSGRLLLLGVDAIDPNISVLNQEMIDFSAEILYQLAGVSRGDSAVEVNRRLKRLGIPVQELRQVAWLASRGAIGQFVAVSTMMSIVIAHFIYRKRMLPRIISILASFYALHGSGGEEFLKYREELRKKGLHRVAYRALPSRGS